jgi:hypothetical protein
MTVIETSEAITQPKIEDQPPQIKIEVDFMVKKLEEIDSENGKISNEPVKIEECV